MNPRDVKKPNVSEDLVVDLVFRLYGIKIISIKRMVSYYDQNFHIQVSNEFQNPYISNVPAEGYTLKITNTAKSAQPGHFDSIHEAMIHINSKGVRVPIPVPNIDGNTWKLEKVPLLYEDVQNSKDYCGIHLLTFLPGRAVSTATYTKSLLYQWGSLLSKFHNAAKDLTSPCLKMKTLFWDLEHVPEIRPFMEGLDTDKMNLVTSVLDKFPQEISEKLPNLRKGFIHGDFNDNNILCQISENFTSEKKEYIVDGILDFEDMHYGTYAWDVGVMLAYSLLDCKSMDPLEGAGHVLAGYLRYRSLDDLELSTLKMCIACRLCQSMVLGAYNYKLDPSNPYLILTSRYGWERLRQVWSMKNEDLRAKWRDIQKQYYKNQ